MQATDVGTSRNSLSPKQLKRLGLLKTTRRSSCGAFFRGLSWSNTQPSGYALLVLVSKFHSSNIAEIASVDHSIFRNHNSALLIHAMNNMHTKFELITITSFLQLHCNVRLFS